MEQMARNLTDPHGERNDQGLQNQLLRRPPPMVTNRRVVRRARLGGLLNFYHREAD